MAFKLRVIDSEKNILTKMWYNYYKLDIGYNCSKILNNKKIEGNNKRPHVLSTCNEHVEFEQQSI